MGLFSRKRREPDDAAHAIGAFWEWWARDGHGIDPRKASATTDELTRRVAAIHPDLTWHFGRGTTSEHRLTVSAGGVAQVRPAAERWLRAAPAPDLTWEYRSSQEADPSAISSSLEIAGSRVDLSLTRFRVEPVEDDLRVHVGVYHPAFQGLPRGVPGRIAFLVLDWVLGEDDVERWLGQVEPLDVAPDSPATAEELRAAVDSIAAHRDPDAWTLAEWIAKDGRPGLAMSRRGVRWIDHPTLDRHHVLTSSYPAQENGLPRDAAVLGALRDLESEIDAALDGAGIVVGHETHAGERRFHVYTDGEDERAAAALSVLAARAGTRAAARPDPSWTEVRHLTG